jgi:hypothetical protein
MSPSSSVHEVEPPGQRLSRPEILRAQAAGPYPTKSRGAAAKRPPARPLPHPSAEVVTMTCATQLGEAETVNLGSVGGPSHLLPRLGLHSGLGPPSDTSNDCHPRDFRTTGP